jgi:tRNA dimethylallyltransferase
VPGAPVPCLLGPTGVGKSDVAVLAARATGGEVIACDAFTVYRGMEVLAAAPVAPADVPHHLVGILDPSEAYSAARFVEDCDRAVAEVRARGRTPWVVGGTALYLRSWLKGVGPRAPRRPDLRARLARTARSAGVETLHRMLAERDPARAREIHPRDERRLVRALEIVEATGRPASEQRREWAGPDRVLARPIGLRRSWEDLDARIAARTRALFAAGVVDEARRLLAAGPSPEARRALGLDDLADLLAGRVDEAAAAESIARRTRRFARKQMTFFRSFAGVTWLDVAPDEHAADVASRAVRAYEATGTSS